MRHRIAEDAKPQLLLLLLATAITLVLWFLPLAEYLVYPIRLFVTFIHESSHALVAVITGWSVQSLTIYDMCKAVQKDIEITDIRLECKSGGKDDYSRR